MAITAKSPVENEKNMSTRWTLDFFQYSLRSKLHIGDNETPSIRVSFCSTRSGLVDNINRPECGKRKRVEREGKEKRKKRINLSRLLCNPRLPSIARLTRGSLISPPKVELAGDRFVSTVSSLLKQWSFVRIEVEQIYQFMISMINPTDKPFTGQSTIINSTLWICFFIAITEHLIDVWVFTV